MYLIINNLLNYIINIIVAYKNLLISWSDVTQDQLNGCVALVQFESLQIIKWGPLDKLELILISYHS